MKKLALILILILINGSAVLAVNGVANDPSQNLLAPRQLGLGGLSVNFSNDGSGVFLNPSQLSGFEFPQITTSSRRIMLDETEYLFAGWAIPTNYGTFGLGYAGMGTAGSIPTVLDPVTGRVIQNVSLEAGNFSSSLLALSYSRKVPNIKQELVAGGNLKFYTQTLSGNASDRGTGIGIDLSATYKPLPWLSLGSVLQNILGGTVQWSGSQDKIGGYLKFGAAANIWGSSREALYLNKQTLSAGLDIDLPRGVLSADNSMLYHLGCEYSPAQNVFLRAGLNQEVAGSGLTFGLGFVNSGFRYDYAYAQRPGLPGDNPHYFSLSYVGDRVLTVERKIKKKTATLKFLAPPDRLITDQDKINVIADAGSQKVYNQVRTWTVISISSTSDSYEIAEPTKLASLYLNGKPLENQGTIEAIEQLYAGRNVFRLNAFTSPEAGFNSIIPATAEVRVLRISPFSDTPLNYWAITPISLNVAMGLVNGYPDNTFKPDKGITRAELVSLLVRSRGIREETMGELATAEAFQDVQTKSWAAKFITYGSSTKLVAGYPDNTFRPDNILTRAEAIAVFARYADLTEESTAVSPFPDLKPEFWANKFIAPAKAAGMLKYLEGKEFKPNEQFTRAEACEVLYNVPSVQKRVDEFWETGIISGSR